MYIKSIKALLNPEYYSKVNGKIFNLSKLLKINSFHYLSCKSNLSCHHQRGIDMHENCFNLEKTNHVEFCIYLLWLLIPRVTFKCRSYNDKFKFFDPTQLPIHNAFSKLNEIIISHCKGYVKERWEITHVALVTMVRLIQLYRRWIPWIYTSLMLNLTTFIGEYPCYLAHITDNNGNDVFSEQIGVNVKEICVYWFNKITKRKEKLFNYQAVLKNHPVCWLSLERCMERLSKQSVPQAG